jgi:antibiotic biosynthesis monooxygenase (ABM) superfamily enzyme
LVCWLSKIIYPALLNVSWLLRGAKATLAVQRRASDLLFLHLISWFAVVPIAQTIVERWMQNPKNDDPHFFVKTGVHLYRQSIPLSILEI